MNPEEKNTQQEWRSEMAKWLGEFSWDWFCSLSYRPYYSVRQRRALLHRWLEELRSSCGTASFGWFAVSERGRVGDNFHFHVLINGLQEVNAAHRLQAMKSWDAMAGDALITDYSGDSGIDYILKNTCPESMDEIEFDLHEGCRMQSSFEPK